MITTRIYPLHQRTLGKCTDGNDQGRTMRSHSLDGLSPTSERPQTMDGRLVGRPYLDKDGRLLPEPYLTTIGFNFQPKEWFLSYRVYDQDWEKLCMFSALFIDEITDACDELIDASFDICDEIQRSDAKGVQAKLQEYMFGSK